MKPIKMREKVANKVISMLSIAMDDIIKPSSDYQSGERTVSSGYYDQFGNRYDIYLKLKVKAGNDNTPDELDVDSESILEDLVAIVNGLKLKEDKDTVYDDSDLVARINALEVHQHDDMADIIDLLHLINPDYLFFRVSSEIGARIGGDITVAYNGSNIQNVTSLFGLIAIDTTNVENPMDGSNKIYTISSEGFVSQNWVYSDDAQEIIPPSSNTHVIPLNRFCEVTLKSL